MSRGRLAANTIGELACEMQALVGSFHRAEREVARLTRALREIENSPDVNVVARTMAGAALSESTGEEPKR